MNKEFEIGYGVQLFAEFVELTKDGELTDWIKEHGFEAFLEKMIQILQVFAELEKIQEQTKGPLN